jgi:predicted nucleic acid-binding protein
MKGGASAVFIDTNVLVFATILHAPFHQQARNRLEALQQTNTILWISPQVIREYLAVVTRPQTFSQPLSAADAARDASVLMQRFHLAEENAAATPGNGT